MFHNREKKPQSLYKMIGDLRLRIVDYFDKLINEIDLKTEKLLCQAKESEDEKKLNERRKAFIDEIKRIESVNLQRLEQYRDFASAENDESLFDSFCFIIPANLKEPTKTNTINSEMQNELGALMVIDKYLSKESIDCYMELLRCYNSEKQLSQDNGFFALKEMVAKILYCLLKK